MRRRRSGMAASKDWIDRPGPKAPFEEERPRRGRSFALVVTALTILMMVVL
jgi:hypothetical protein